jgi:hypothetical protein
MGILPSKRSKSLGNNGRFKGTKKLDEEAKRSLVMDTQAEVKAAI